MGAEDKPVICDICGNGRVTERTEEVAFRQWSDKGYVHCRATVLVGTCDICHATTIGPEASKICDEAFRREYEKLRGPG